MPYEWLEDYCASKKGAVKEFKPEWNALRYMVGGKMFALQGEDNMGRPIITLKLPPVEGEILRSQYEDIRPGYYMNKLHWNSVCLHGAVPDHVLKDMIDISYGLLFASLTKKAQQEIAG